MSTQDSVTLSDRERRQLARLQSMLESADPQLARVLAGAPAPPQGWRPRLATKAKHGIAWLDARSWTGVVLTLAGMALVIVTLPLSPWLGIVGCTVLGAGLALGIARLQRYVGRPGDRAAKPRGGTEGSS